MFYIFNETIHSNVLDWKLYKIVNAVFIDFFKTDDVKCNIIYTTKAKMEHLNSTYRFKTGPTDVLSFPTVFSYKQGNFIGDIYICYDVAKNRKHSQYNEFVFLIIHGLLHLKGFDHEKKLESILMFRKQTKLLKRINKIVNIKNNL